MENLFLYSHKQDLNTISAWDSLHGLEPTNWWYLRFCVHITGLGITWLGNLESILLPNQNQCHWLLNNTQNSRLQQFHIEHCNMIGNGELWHFPTNPAEAVNKRELQQEKKPVIRTKGVLMAIRYTEVPLTPSLLYLNSWNFLACICFPAFSI